MKASSAQQKLKTLDDQISHFRAEIKSDSYPMSIGELLNMYKDNELDIHPEFQRFFRWTDGQKSRLVESLLLGIPLPSVFVSQRKDGVWDVIDGLQRLSTIFQLVGVLRNEDNIAVDRLTLLPTSYLADLEGKHWSEDDKDPDGLGRENQLLIKRTKIPITIILRESSESSKYELFQRLNTGGSPLSDQELRNCILLMVDKSFYEWIVELAQVPEFANCVEISENKMSEQYNIELVLRFLIFRRMADENLRRVGDLGEFLTDQSVALAESQSYDRKKEKAAFEYVFSLVQAALEDDSFRRYDSQRKRFVGPFSISAFEVIALGLGYHYEALQKKKNVKPDVEGISRRLWKSTAFLEASKPGVRGSTRIPNTVRLGRKFFEP